MRVVWEASSLLPPRTGVGRYAFALMRALLKRGEADAEFHLVWRSMRRSLSDADCAALEGAQLHSGTWPPGPILQEAWHWIGKPRIERLAGLNGADLLHGVAAILPASRARAAVLTVHDLHFMRHPEHAHLLGGKFLRRHLPRAVKRSTRVIVPSEATARDCEALLGVDRGRLAVIPHGGAEEFATPPSDEAWERFEKHSPNLPARFWLTVATIEPRKNLGALLDAIEILRGRESEAANLLLAGGHGWGASRIENRLVALHEEELVHSVGHVDTEWLRCALRRAEGLVMPSLAEGFGLPLLEAMASGCPVLCSDIPVFHEVTGDNALFFDPHRPESIADALHSAFQNRPAQSARAERARAFIAPFTWARAAERTLEVYREALQ